MLFIVSLCTLLYSCNESDSDSMYGTDAVKVTMALSTRAAIGEPKEPVSDAELINDYYIVFADKSGKIIETFSKDCAPTELDEFTLELAPGAYFVYAFANIPETYISTTLKLTKGATLKNIPNTLATTYYPIAGAFNNNTLISTDDFAGNIPMTSFEAVEITVSEKATQTFGIEVRRLFAKLQFDYTNNTTTDLTLRKQSVSNLTINESATNGSVRLMNYNDLSVLLSPKARYATLTHEYATPMQLSGNGGTGSQSFYVLESVADVITNSFILDFDVVKKGESPTVAIDYMRYAMTDSKTLTSIRRNDWIRIPIVFSEWHMRLEARNYPPIGGYPEAEILEDNSNEFTITFQGGGEFTIRPFIRKYYDGSDWFGIDHKTKIKGTPTITVEDGSLLFTTAPHLTESGEIIGKMRILPGRKACVTITVEVIENADEVLADPTKPLVTKPLTRKIYVTQK